MSERFTEVPSGVKWFKDNATGLEWSETAPHLATFDEANGWCKSVGGRVPSARELLTLVDYTLANPCTIMQDTVSSAYWSACRYKPFTELAWTVNFNDGGVLAASRRYKFYLRAVRGTCK